MADDGLCAELRGEVDCVFRMPKPELRFHFRFCGGRKKVRRRAFGEGRNGTKVVQGGNFDDFLVKRLENPLDGIYGCGVSKLDVFVSEFGGAQKHSVSVAPKFRLQIACGK